MRKPRDVQLIGDEVALVWDDGREDFFKMERLRAASPSAENLGEADLFGNVRGGDSRKHFPGVRVDDWEYVGNYALRFLFNDGHSTGLYTFKYLRALADHEQGPGETVT